jgi:hypothetical protein
MFVHGTFSKLLPGELQWLLLKQRFQSQRRLPGKKKTTYSSRSKHFPLFIAKSNDGI